MTALAQLAHHQDLDAPTIDRLLAQHLVETFAAHARPERPVDLELVFDAEGATIRWRDPGAETFHAAAEFHWSLFSVDSFGTPIRLIAGDAGRTTSARPRFAVKTGRYALRVHASNQCPGGDRVDSAPSTMRRIATCAHR
ncbi:MAG: hypothetical protein ABI678_07880 [Kofleriaceae bacterium]